MGQHPNLISPTPVHCTPCLTHHLTDPLQIVRLDIRRRARLGGILHE